MSGHFEKALDQTQARLSHTLKRMRSKGYYTDRFGALLDKIDAYLPLEENYISSLFMSIQANTREFTWEDMSIPDSIWYCAIECAMFALHQNEFHDPDFRFAPHLDHDVWLIYAYALLLSCSWILSKDKQELEQRIRIDEAQVKEQNEPDPCVAAQQTSQIDPAEAELLRSRIKQLEAELVTEKRRSDREIRKLEHELNRMRSSEEQKLVSLRKQNAQLIEFILHPEQNATDEPEDISEEPSPEEEDVPVSNLKPLPSQRVLFLGGHTNLVKKLRGIHPDWLFMTDNNFNLKSMASIDIIFFWTAHASHKLQERVFSDLPNIPSIVYVTATNLDRLEQEMISGYNKLFS